MGKALVVVALATAGLLLIPLVAMQFTREVSWGPGDFLAAGALLFGGGAAIVLAMRWFQGRLQRGAAVAAIVLVVAIVWAELAVGVFR